MTPDARTPPRTPPRTIEDMAPAEKGKALRAPDPVTDQDGVFEALLYPNRSLPNAGFAAVMTIVIVVNLTLGSIFFALGAWPVIGFCGLDVFLVWLAFKLSYRQGRLHERVRIEPEEMLVSRVLPSGHETRWRLHPYWTRVHVDNRGKHETRVRVTSKGRTLILGAFLSPPERETFGDALSEALADLRSARP